MFGWFRPKRPVDDGIELDLDVGPEPPPPPPEDVATSFHEDDSAYAEFCLNIATIAGHQAAMEVDSEERLRGMKYSDAERMDVMRMRGEFHCRTMLMQHEQQRARHGMDERLLQEVAELKTLVANQQAAGSRTSLDQVGDFWREHPFLVGWFGADIIHKLKKNLQ